LIARIWRFPQLRPWSSHTKGTIRPLSALLRIHREVVMRVFLGMILGALLLVAGVYIRDSMSTSTVANGQVAQSNRTIVNWDVAAADWSAMKARAHEDWVRISSK
jgi:uncharacterized membrane protein